MSNNYLIVGDDVFIRTKEENKIRDKFLSQDETDLNLSVFRVDELEQISDSLRTLPFLADKRVILIKDLSKPQEDFSELIKSYISNPFDTSVLVISGDSSFKKSKLFKDISCEMDLINADKPTPLDIKKWIPSFFKKEGIDISREAVELIAELKGDDTAGIKGELEKLVSFSGGRRIDTSDVEELIGRSVTDTVFDLVDAINAGNADWVFRILNDLYSQKKQPSEIIGYLGWYIRIMQKISLFSGKGCNTGQIASELGYSASYTKRLVDQSKSYPIKRIEKWLTLLLEADKDIKMGRKTPGIAIETLLVNLIQ